MPEIPISSLEVYAFCDPASGKAARLRRRRARQAIIVGARDWLDRWFVLEAWAGHLTPSQLLTRVLDTYDKWRPRRFGIEANGMQVLFGSLVQDAAEERFGRIKMLPIYQPTNVEKTYRIRTGLEPVVNSGRLFVTDKTSDLAVEIRGFPTAATKDLVDGLESVIRFSPKRPEMQVKDREAQQFAAYLRSTGCPAHLIKARVADYQNQQIERK